MLGKALGGWGGGGGGGGRERLGRGGLTAAVGGNVVGRGEGQEGQRGAGMAGKNGAMRGKWRVKRKKMERRDVFRGGRESAGKREVGESGSSCVREEKHAGMREGGEKVRLGGVEQRGYQAGRNKMGVHGKGEDDDERVGRKGPLARIAAVGGRKKARRSRPYVILAKHRTPNEPLGMKKLPVKRKSQGTGLVSIGGDDEPNIFRSCVPFFTVPPGAMCQVVSCSLTTVAPGSYN